MNATPPPLPSPGAPKDPMVPKREVLSTTGAQAQYNRIADKVGLLPNVRKKDNLYQGICVLACAVVGLVLGWFWDGAAIRDFVGDAWPVRMVIGALVGLVAGALLSGVVLLVLGLLRKT